MIVASGVRRIVRDRAYERPPQPVDLLERADVQCGLAELCTLECERQMIREVHEQLTVVTRARDIVKHEETHRSAGSGERDGTRLVAATLHVRTEVRPGSPEDETSEPSSLSLNGSPEAATTSRRSSTGRRSATPRVPNTGADGHDDRLYELRHGTFFNEKLRELEQAPRLRRVNQRIRMCPVERVDNTDDDHHHDRVHGEGEPVLTVCDRERPVGGMKTRS